MNLPEAFKDRMRYLIHDDAEYESFISSYDRDKSYGLRINPLKLDSALKLPFVLHPVPWAAEGFYADADEHPGRHPLHEAGAYYIQEPSAMSVVSLLDPQPGDIVCDLCAAPGGKSTQIAGRLKGQGLLVSNEIFSARAKILSQNIERLGVANAIVCNEPPDRMAMHFPGFFDKIVVDAPCSGEGMFRKDDTAINEWSPEQVEICAERQQMILDYAETMLKPGGTMVYSTCTFAPAEDEEMLLWFLRKYPYYQVIDYKEVDMTANHIKCSEPTEALTDNGTYADYELSDGRCDFISDDFGSLTEIEVRAISGSLRLWPHKLHGEGHFAVKLYKSPDANLLDEVKTAPKKKSKKKASSRDILSRTDRSDLMTFLGKLLTDITSYKNAEFQYFGDELYLIPYGLNSVKGIKLERAGLHIASRKKNRFEPAHALAKALKTEDCASFYQCNESDALKYLHGESINCDVSLKGWTLVCYMDCPLGWAKATNGTLKNHYPKGLRINI